jgi:peroxiredoxin
MSIRSNPEITETVASARPLPSGTRIVWGFVLLLLIVILVARVKQARTQAALAEHQISMHDASSVFEERLTRVAPQQRQAEALRLAQDVSPGLRYASIDALADNPTPAAVDAIEQAFTDNASEVRKRAMETLIDADKGGTRGLRVLLAAVRDEDTWIREDALAQINTRFGRPHSPVDKRVAPTLMAALGDPDAAVCASAANALCKLTGKRWKISMLSPPAKRQAVIARWRQWWQGAQKDWPATQEWTSVPSLAPTRSDPAPEFTQEDTQGQNIGSDNLRGKITLLNFWATWCGPCKIEAPDLVKIHDMYKDRNVNMVGMACSEKSKSALLAWCRDEHITYRQCMATSDVRKAFGDIEEVPVSFLIDAQGRVRYRWDGERDYATYQSAIERLLREDASRQQGVLKQ